MRGSLAFLVLAALVATTGCRSSRRSDRSDAGTLRVDGGPGVDGGGFDAGPPPTTEGVDVLLMVDNSNSMTEEQGSLAAQLPSLVDRLSTLHGSLQFGVITADMGTGGHTVPTCAEPVFGDDGVLRTDGNTTLATCEARYPAFLAHAPGSDVASFATDLSCVAVAGTGGCGFEQQLEAVLKAVTPSTATASGAFDGRFFMGTSGHADGFNSGFIRSGAHLAIVLLTDEEDCSAADPDLFNQASVTYSGDLNLRCFMYPEALHTVRRYVDGLLATRAPSSVSLTVVAGIPLAVEGGSFDDILNHPDMRETIDSTMPTRLRPSCNTPGRGLAFPPRRIVELGQGLDAAGSRVEIVSICRDDFTPVTDAIVRATM